MTRHTVAEFGRIVREYIDWDKHFKQQSKKIHDMEHEADQMCLSTGRAMFADAMPP
ncbi:MAG: hypothetical protein KAY32_07245 [Candidatus Eisenbacteria sp.]|nr:hypothetical protein [Candidatus Eisenbacteria bacterium]